MHWCKSPEDDNCADTCNSKSIVIYIYIYICVCVCVCVFKVLEDGNCAEICRSKSIVKYIIHAYMCMYACKIVRFVGAGRVCKSIYNTRNEQYESSSE